MLDLCDQLKYLVVITSMAGSDQESKKRTAKKMTSRLRLRKKKYNPPLQEPPDPQYVQCNKTTDKPEMTNKKISITQSNTNEEPKKTNIRSYAEIAGPQPRLISLKNQRKQPQTNVHKLRSPQHKFLMKMRYSQNQ